MVLRDQRGAAVSKQVGWAVADIEHTDLVTPDGCNNHRAAHARPFRVVASRFEDGRVGLLARALEAIEVRTFVAILREHARKGGHGDAAGHLPGGMTAHPITDDEKCVEAGLVAPNDHGVLVLLALETGVGRRGDLKTHRRDCYPPRTEK